MRVLKQRSDQDLLCLPFCLESFEFYTPPHDNCRVLWFHVGVHVSVRPPVHLLYVHLSVFLFLDDNFNGSSPDLVSVLIWWRSASCIFVSGQYFYPIPHHTIVAGYYGFKLVSVCQSVHPSIHPSLFCMSVCWYFCFRTITTMDLFQSWYVH